MKLGLSILLNNACNLKCKYCYEKNNGDEFLTKENLDSIINRFQKSYFFNNDIEFFGGEPTMSLNVIEYIVNKFNCFNYRIITNGFFLNYNEVFYQILSKFSGVIISIELTQKSFKFYRNRDDLSDFIDKIIYLNKKWKNVSVNVSINDLITENIDEFIDNINKFRKENIPIHFYSLKYKSNISERQFYDFLMYIKQKDESIYESIILKDNNISDTEFTCTFENRICINSNMEIVNCAWMNKKPEKKLTIENSDDEILNSYLESIAKNHKINFTGCSNCEVELGKCSISCRAFFEEIEKNNDLATLEKLCNFEKIKEYLRKNE